jgi:hypothetical protein
MKDDMHDETHHGSPNEMGDELHGDMSDDTVGNAPDDSTNDDAIGARDVRFDMWVPNAARDYNRPPSTVPREEMWAQISASLRASQNASRSSAPPVVVPVGAAATARRSARPWQMAAAAVLLLGTGIVIGQRFSATPEGVPTVAAVPALQNDSSAGSMSSGPATADSPRIAASGADHRVPTAPRFADGRGDAGYALATVDHLARAEALLTSFKGTRSDSADASLERWAQDLLADTRLLLDSPAAGDSRRRRLLEDLELVLAQIVQLRAESSADRSIVRKSIERGEVLTRIRSTIPAGSASGV